MNNFNELIKKYGLPPAMFGMVKSAMTTYRSAGLPATPVPHKGRNAGSLIAREDVLSEQVDKITLACHPFAPTHIPTPQSGVEPVRATQATAKEPPLNTVQLNGIDKNEGKNE